MLHVQRPDEAKARCGKAAVLTTCLELQVVLLAELLHHSVEVLELVGGHVGTLRQAEFAADIRPNLAQRLEGRLRRHDDALCA